MRSDMYSIGCVYYNALTGIYPFNGETGLQVMTAHLHHQVIPLQEVRPDIPLWACDWVMWHLNRLTTDRPQNARESLKIFLQNSNVRSSAMSTKPAQSATGQLQPTSPINSGSSSQGPATARAIPEPPRTQTAPQSLLPPEGSKPSVHSSPPPPPPPAVVLPTATAFPLAQAAPAAPAPRLASATRPAASLVPKSTHIPKAAIGPRVAVAVGAGHAPAPVAAIQACRTITAEKDFAKLIDIVDVTSNPDIRQAAEDSAADMLKKSVNRQSLGSKVSTSLTTASTADVKYALIRLLGCAGGVKAADTVKTALAASDKKEQLAAAMALASWPDDAMFETLIAYLDTLTDAQARAPVFNACVTFVANPDRTRSPEISVKFWNLLKASSKSPVEQAQVERARASTKK